MYYQQGVFNCDYCIKTNLDIQKHIKFATFSTLPIFFCKLAVILDLFKNKTHTHTHKTLNSTKLW